MSRDSPRLYEFGPYRLNVGERLLTRAGEPISLPPKAFDTLVVLVANAGHLVDKDRMMHEIWPDAFVEEANLSVNVSALRKALGDTPDGHPYIETVAKRGYRFIADVRERQPDGAGSQPAGSAGVEIDGGSGPPTIAPSAITEPLQEAEVEPPSAPVHRFRPGRVIFGAVILVSLAMASYWVLTHLAISLAVLPFETSEADPYVQILCDSATKRIIDGLSLSGHEGFRVKARSAVLNYAGERPNAVEAGRALGVDFVLSGNVRRQAGAIFSVQVELVRVSDGVQIFGKEFDDVFHPEFPTLSQTIVHETVTHLPIRLNAADLKRMAAPESKSPAAVRLMERADGLFWNASPESFYQMISLCQQAIDLDPTYAAPYGEIASAYGGLGDIGAMRPREAEEKVRLWANKALRVDDTDYRGRLSLLVIDARSSGSPAAKGFLERNLPGFAFENLVASGKLENLEKWADRYPDEPLRQINVGLALYYQRRFDAAIAHFKQMLAEEDSDRWYVRNSLAFALLHARRMAEASQEFERVKSLYPNAGRTGVILVAAREGRRTEAARLLAELQGRTSHEYVPHVWLGWGYAALGDKDEAFRQMRLACEEHERFLKAARVDPQFDPLRDDPRFRNVLACSEELSK